jgi:hypothetical protein
MYFVSALSQKLLKPFFHDAYEHNTVRSVFINVVLVRVVYLFNLLGYLFLYS